MPGFEKPNLPRVTSFCRLFLHVWQSAPTIFFLFALAGCVTACAPLRSLLKWPTPLPPSTETLQYPFPSVIPSPSTTPIAPSPTPSAMPPLTPSPEGRSVITLTVWLPPEMVPDLAESPEVGAFVASAHAAFLAAQRGVRLQTVPKALYGPGGMVDLLLAMQPVAPWRLPDVALVDASELPALVEKGLAIPLDALISASVWDDLFPFALEAVSADGNLYGVPFQADIPLLVYNREALSEPPQHWEQLLVGGNRIVFPAAQGEDGAAADLFMVQYLARGGKAPAPPFSLDAVIAARVLRDYRNAFERGVLVPESREAPTWEKGWAFYLAGTAEMTLASSWQYLRDRALLTQSHYGTVPTASASQFTLARSLVWVILSQEPARCQLAAQYVLIMMDADRLGEWSAVSYHLPARRSSYQASFEPTFRAFLENQLVHASPYPLSPTYLKAREEIARAIEDVLDGVTTPERAASTLAVTISRLR